MASAIASTMPNKCNAGQMRHHIRLHFIHPIRQPRRIGEINLAIAQIIRSLSPADAKNRPAGRFQFTRQILASKAL